MMPKNLILVRHGESVGNVVLKSSKNGDESLYTDEFINQYHSDWRLTDKGVEQAIAAGKFLKEQIIDNYEINIFKFNPCFVSSYVRAMETAYYLNIPDAEWKVESLLREREWGNIGNISHKEWQQNYPLDYYTNQQTRFYWIPSNGESIAQLCQRLKLFLDTLHRENCDDDVLIVCHGEVMWAFRFLLTRMSIEEFEILDRSKDNLDKIHNCQIIHFTRYYNNFEDLSEYYQYYRSTCPWDLSLSTNEWQKITRKKFSNKDLIDYVNKHKKLI